MVPTSSTTTRASLDKVPEISRRGRAFPVWAVLQSLGRSGVADLVERLCRTPRPSPLGCAAIRIAVAGL